MAFSQTYMANPIINATNYCAVATDNGNGFPNGGILYSSIVHEPVFPPHEGSTSTTYTGMDELSQILTAGGGRNLAASSKSIDFSFPQQHANNCKLQQLLGFLLIFQYV